MIEGNGNQIRVAIYLRVSTEDQIERYGLPMQKEAIMSLIKSKGHGADNKPRMVFAGEQYLYQEEGISGTTKLFERPAFSRLIEDITTAPKGKKPFDAVAVYKIDRFARKLSVLLDTVSFFEQYDILMLSANESIDTSTPFGRAVLGIIGVIAELEIETFKERSLGGRKAAIDRGVFMGGTPPFGYIKDHEKKLEILEDEAQIVRDIYHQFIIEQKSPQEIADKLSSLGIPSPDASAIKYKKRRGGSKKKNKDTFWRDSKIRKILDDEIYIGTYYYSKYEGAKRLPKKKWKKSPYIQPSIIEKADFVQAQRLLVKSKARIISKKRSAKGKHVYLLSGLLRCENCVEEHRTNVMPVWVGEPKRHRVSGETVYSYYYKCGRRSTKKFSEVCSVITLPAEQVEQIVLEQVQELLQNPQPVINYQNKLKSSTLEVDSLKKKRETISKLINAIPDRIEKLKEQHVANIIGSLTELQDKIKEVEDKQKTLEAELVDIDTKIGKITLSKNYLSTFDYFRNKYLEMLRDANKDRKAIQELLDVLLTQVVVRSRPVTKDDTISGRRKEGQQIPYKIDLYFRLPQDMLKEAFIKFGVKNADL